MKEILDSGNRREFDTGAVRDIQEGKGRCDLMPLDVIAHNMADRAFCWNVLCCIWTCMHHPELNDYTVKGGVQE